MSDKDSHFRNDLQKRLDKALVECVQLRAENERLRFLLGLSSNTDRLEEKISHVAGLREKAKLKRAGGNNVHLERIFSRNILLAVDGI